MTAWKVSFWELRDGDSKAARRVASHLPRGRWASLLPLLLGRERHDRRARERLAPEQHVGRGLGARLAPVGAEQDAIARAVGSRDQEALEPGQRGQSVPLVHRSLGIADDA